MTKQRQRERAKKRLQKLHQENAAAYRAHEREKKEMEAFDLLVQAKMREMFGIKERYTDYEFDEAFDEVSAQLNPDHNLD